MITGDRHRKNDIMRKSNIPLCHLLVKTSSEQLSGSEHSIGRPLVRLGQLENLLPIAQSGDDLEGLGQATRGVELENLTNSVFERRKRRV